MERDKGESLDNYLARVRTVTEADPNYQKNRDQIQERLADSSPLPSSPDFGRQWQQQIQTAIDQPKQLSSSVKDNSAPTPGSDPWLEAIKQKALSEMAEAAQSQGVEKPTAEAVAAANVLKARWGEEAMAKAEIFDDFVRTQIPSPMIEAIEERYPGIGNNPDIIEWITELAIKQKSGT